MSNGKKLRVNHVPGLKLRQQPVPTLPSQAVVSHGTLVDAIGEPLEYDSRFEFQEVRTPAGLQGWLTYRDGDTVYLIQVADEWDSDDGSKFRVVWQHGLKLRDAPEPALVGHTIVPRGTEVVSLGEAFSHVDGYVFQRVRTPQGVIGWLTRSYRGTIYLVKLEDGGEEPPPEEESGTLWVIWPVGLKLRGEPVPTLHSDVTVPYGTQVTTLGDPFDHPDGYRFQKVRLQDGRTGWLTLSYAGTHYLDDEQPDMTIQPVPVAQVNAAAGMWAKMHESPGGAVTWWVGGAVPLRVQDPAGAGAKIGQAGQWIEVETPAFRKGFIEGRYLKPFAAGNHPTARHGESPFIYGIHDRYDRNLFQGGTNGWVLFTYGIGLSGDQAGGDRATFYDWANAGFGVIARLNHGYDSAGTVPEPQHYDAFVATCAAFVRKSIDPANSQGGCHIWIIGNEMNNPREYPGNNQGQGGQAITPESYADCFNRTYKAIKTVYTEFGLNPSHAVVVPGAVDPYNADAGCSGEWFTRMLRAIEALDGLALHAYTHGASSALVTSRKRFGDEHNPPVRFPDNQLSWQYYDFYAYRTFMDLIPAKWRNVPVFITETDQVQEVWSNENSGWVKNMYAEIDNWNSDPRRQRVCCSLLFRWEAFDGKWQIKDKGNVLQDLREAAAQGYRW